MPERKGEKDNRRRITINGTDFDSIAEADRCKILRVIEKIGKSADPV